MLYALLYKIMWINNFIFYKIWKQLNYLLYFKLIKFSEDYLRWINFTTKLYNNSLYKLVFYLKYFIVGYIIITIYVQYV